MGKWFEKNQGGGGGESVFGTTGGKYGGDMGFVDRVVIGTPRLQVVHR